MNNILTPEIIEAVGWTIVHSLWQSIAVALILLLLLVSLRQRSAQIKYFISFVSLIAVLIGSAVTFYKAYQHATEKKEIAEKMVSTPGYISGILQSKLTGEAPDGNTLDIRYVKIRVFMQRHFDTIVVAWILGIFLLMVRFMGGIVYTRRLRTRQTVNLSDEWLLKITELSSKFGIHQRIEAFCSSLARVPMTLGYMKPVIIIPLSAITGLAPKEIEAIIAHELAHVARNDYFFNLIQSLIEIVFFYNPTVWLISSKIRTEREHCCDMLAIEATNDRLAYVKTLANIQLQQSPYAQNFSMAITGHKNSMLQRIKHLQKQEVMKTNWIEKMMIAGIIMITLTLVSFTVNNKINNLSKHKEASRDSINITKVEADSIKAAFEQKITNMKSNAKSNEELEEVMETAYSTNDTALYCKVMEDVDKAMKEVNVGEIVRQAMKEAAKEVEKAYKEIDQEKINKDMKKAQRDIMAARAEAEHSISTGMKEAGIDQVTIDATLKATKAGLDAAATAVGSINEEDIIKSALKGVSTTLNAVSEVSVDSQDSFNNADELTENNDTHDKQIKELEREKKNLLKEQKD